MFSGILQRLNDLWYHNELNAGADTTIQLSSMKLDIKIMKNNAIVRSNFFGIIWKMSYLVNM